jgi:hypothetical protein
MKSIAKSLFFVLSFLLVSKIGLSQENTNGNYLFKVWLYIEKPNVTMRIPDKFPIKDSSLFYFFSKNIGIRTDTIESKSFSSDYVFLSV